MLVMLPLTQHFQSGFRMKESSLTTLVKLVIVIKDDIKMDEGS